jgi:presenilin-like A22 family membrane protease
MAAVATAAAFGLPPAIAWPVQNGINICIAISVSRLLALGRLLPIMLALAALAAYDVAFAGGSAAMAHALDPAPTVAEAQSVMESVARSRLSGAWQPGLIQVRVGGRLTDGLGLGDIVFPSLLAGWAARFDRRPHAGADLLPAVIGGYAVGCVLLEVAPAALSPAALSCLVPTTLTATMLRLAATGAIDDAFSWDGAPVNPAGQTQGQE